MVDFYFRMLHPLSTPLDDVLSIIPKEFVNMLKPGTSFCGISQLDRRGSVEIEAGNPVSFDPATFGNQSALNQHVLTRSPGHLLNRSVLVEPCARIYSDLFSLCIEHWLTIIKHWNTANSCIDTARRPKLPRRNIEV